MILDSEIHLKKQKELTKSQQILSVPCTSEQHCVLHSSTMVFLYASQYPATEKFKV